MKRITCHTFAQATRCLQLDDVVYLPQGNLTFQEQRSQGEWLAGQQWFLNLLPPELAAAITATAGYNPYSFWVRLLVDYYSNHLLRYKTEPEWLCRLNSQTIRHIRREVAIAGEFLEPHTIVPTTPLTGLGYIVLEDGLAAKTIATFGLGRLQGIRQLGFLHDPVVRKAMPEVAGMGQLFSHTRYLHTHDVHAIALLLARNSGLSEDDERHLRVAALTHDALTPAGGDTIKLIAPRDLDEEVNYPSLFTTFPWEALRDEHQLSQERLTTIVSNGGVLGRLLDLADKIAYVARDSSMFLGRLEYLGFEVTCETFREIRRFTEDHPEVCTLWDSVTVEDGRVVVEDGERLADFLKLRALLFRNVYYAPEARFLEHLLAKVVVQYLFDKKLLSIRQLLNMRDQELEFQIDQLMGEFFCSRTIGLDLRAFAETFETEAEARHRERELVGEGALTLLDRFHGSVSSGASFLVRHSGRIKELKAVYPRQVADIEATLGGIKRFRLYYLWPAEWGPYSGEAMRRIYRHHRERVLGSPE